MLWQTRDPSIDTENNGSGTVTGSVGPAPLIPKESPTYSSSAGLLQTYIEHSSLCPFRVQEKERKARTARRKQRRVAQDTRALQRQRLAG